MAISNVVELPTAAKKKVRQCPSRTKAADWEALIPFPMEKVITPFHESVLSDARAMMEVDTKAVMQVALAVFSVLPDNDQIRALGRMAGLALRQHEGTNSALAWLNYEFSSPERKRELFAAAGWLQERGGL